MLKSNIAVQFNNFHPSQNTKNFVDSVIQSIQDELPSGATVRATFTKQKNVVKGMLQIGSYSGPLFAVASAEGLKEVTFRLVEQIRRRMDKWKSRRHERRALRHLNVKEEAVDENRFS